VFVTKYRFWGKIISKKERRDVRGRMKKRWDDGCPRI